MRLFHSTQEATGGYFTFTTRLVLNRECRPEKRAKLPVEPLVYSHLLRTRFVKSSVYCTSTRFYCVCFDSVFWVSYTSPTMASNRALPNSKEALLKSYNTRLKDDVKSMQENFEGEESEMIVGISPHPYSVTCRDPQTGQGGP